MEFPLMEQRSPEWYALHSEYITSSNFDTIVNGTEKGWMSLIKNLNNPREFYSKHTEWGKQYEDEALSLFEMLTGIDTYKIGFATHDDHKFVGCSPDFLVNPDIGGEIKCPSNSANHYMVMMSRKVPRQYVAQVQGGMWCTGRKQWWFLSYDPRQRPEHRLVWFLVDRDDAYIAKLERRVLGFLRVWKGGEPTSNYFGGIGSSLPQLF